MEDLYSFKTVCKSGPWLESGGHSPNHNPVPHFRLGQRKLGKPRLGGWMILDATFLKKVRFPNLTSEERLSDGTGPVDGNALADLAFAMQTTLGEAHHGGRPAFHTKQPIPCLAGDEALFTSAPPLLYAG